jgi:hypothetical protein
MVWLPGSGRLNNWLKRSFGTGQNKEEQGVQVFILHTVRCAVKNEDLIPELLEITKKDIDKYDNN